MKRTIALFIILILSVVLVGCNIDNTVETFVDGYNLDDLIVTSNPNKNDIVPKTNLISIYALSHQNFKQYSCEINNKEEILYIAGYLENKSIKYIDEYNDLSLTMPFDYDYYVHGTNNNLFKYQTLCDKKILNTKDYPIYFKLYNQNEIPCYLKNKELIFVLKIQKFDLIEIGSDNVETINICLNVAGEYNQSNSYVINSNDSDKELHDKYIFTDETIKKYYFKETFNSLSVPIQQYNDNYCIYESCDAILDDIDSNDYYEKIKECIISPNTELKSGTYLIYDYEKVKKFFIKEE